MRLQISIPLVAFTVTATSSFAATYERNFHFTNGNKAVYQVNTETRQFKVKILSDKGEIIKTIDPDPITKPWLRVLQYHDDPANSSETVYTVTANQAPEPGSTFTWYEDTDGKYLLFEDGTLKKARSDQWNTVSAKLIENNQEKYSLESYKFSTGDFGKSDELTEIIRLSDSQFQQLDTQYHPDLYKKETDILLKDHVLTIGGFPIQVNLNDFQSTSLIKYGEETFQIKSVESERSGLRGTYLIRASDSKEFKVDLEPVFYNKQGSPRYFIEDGIVSVAGISKKVDLREFEGEIRRFNRTSEPDSVRNDSGYSANPVTEISRNYKDLVEQSIKHPREFAEKSDPVVIQSLAEAVRGKRSVVVIGKAGTGKTSAIRAFARDVGQGLIPGIPRTMQIFEVKMANLASGTKYTGTIEERIGMLVAAAQKSGCIFFIDELHSMAGIGTSEHRSNDITQFIKGPLELGQMIILGTDTSHEFEMAFGGDAPFMQRFRQVKISEPKDSELIGIVQARMKRDQESGPDTPITEEAVRFSGEYDLTAAQPRAAINLLTTAYDKMGSRGLEGHSVDRAALIEAVKSEYNVDPAFFSRELTNEKLNHLKESLNSEVIGHLEAKRAVVSIWRRKFTGVGDPEQVNSILFVGPPGVGKTKIAEASAVLMGYDKTVIEMNKYQSGGIEDFRREVYEAIRKNQFRVIILDEIEKAHVSVQEGALSMLQSGNFTVQVKRGQGTINNEVNAKHAIFMMTSNAASNYVRRESKVTDKDLRGRLSAEGISDTVLSRLQYVIPMRNPKRTDYKAGIRMYLNKTLERESQKHHVHFVLVKEGTNRENAIAQLRKVTDPTIVKTEEQYIHEYNDFINPFIDEYVTAMASTFTKNTDDFRDVKRMMIKIEEKAAQALGNSDVEPGQTIFIEWDDSFIPEKGQDSENPLVN